MPLVKRHLGLSFSLAGGKTFAESGTDTVEIAGLRAQAHIVKMGSVPIKDMLELDVYGLTASLIKQLSTLGMEIQVQPRNTVTLTAGDAVNGMSTVFIGQMYNAYGDFSRLPDVGFHLSAQAVLYDAVATSDPTSYSGPTPVATIMQKFAGQLGLTFENNGVSSTLSYPYYYGSVFSQLSQCAKAAGIGWTIDSKSQTLAIWPKNGSRNTGSMPVISPSTGLDGYPSFTAQGISLRTLWNPSFSVGSLVQVQTGALVVQPADGVWSIFKQEDHLDAETPNGEWHSILGCYNPKFPAPLPQ